MLVRAWDRLIEGLAVLAGCMIAGVCLLIVWDVIARNIGLQPPASTVALTEYALLYFTMAAAPWLVRTRGHIVVDALHRRFSGALLSVVDRFILVLCAGVCGLIGLLAGLLMVEAWQRGELEIRSLSTPRWLLFAPLAIGFVLMGGEFLRLLVRGESVTASGMPGETL
jgi:TRAP-type C4-dicarboxylate transport system permease small subunit